MKVPEALKKVVAQEGRIEELLEVVQRLGIESQARPRRNDTDRGKPGENRPTRKPLTPIRSHGRGETGAFRSDGTCTARTVRAAGTSGQSEAPYPRLWRIRNTVANLSPGLAAVLAA